MSDEDTTFTEKIEEIEIMSRVFPKKLKRKIEEKEKAQTRLFRNRQTDYAVPTGEIIEEHSKYLHMSQECFAQGMGRCTQK